jgi:hypothetical protein
MWLIETWQGRTNSVCADGPERPSRLMITQGSAYFLKLVDAHNAVRQNSPDFKLAAHRFDDLPKRADIPRVVRTAYLGALHGRLSRCRQALPRR